VILRDVRMEKSIFEQYYTQYSFRDLFLERKDDAVDVIIPVIHTNELWKANLLSFYREIPINRLLIGDGGCIDDSIDIAKTFPRITVLDHRSYQSLGYSIRKLIEAVETEWFIYIHSDAYLPPGWFDLMQKHQSDYDWFGCKMQHTFMIEYDLDYENRPWAGSQMGRKKAFEAGLSRIDDDFVYRQEDFIFADIVRKAGYKEGKVPETFHYHQTINKTSPWARKIKKIKVEVETSKEEDIRTCMTQAKGLVKYLDPDETFADGIKANIDMLQAFGEYSWEQFFHWMKETNPDWLPLFAEEIRRNRRRDFLISLKRGIKRILK